MPANTAQTGRRSVCEQDALDESQLEAELCRLQRQLHVMEGNRRTYSEEACNLLRKQQAEIIALKKENDEINKILRLAKSDRNEAEDSRDIDKLLSLIDKLDEYKRLCADEERQVKELDEEILRTQGMINEERKLAGSATEEHLEMSITKRLRVTENRLDQELIKFNNQLAENANLREELDHLRQEKSVFDTIHKKLNKQLEDTKQKINQSITQAAHAYEERDEAQNKMLALKERSDKDKTQQEIEMKELMRIIQHDNKLKEFMGIKVHDRADLKEEELIKKQKGKDSVDKDQDIEKQSIKQLEAAFDRITEATGESDINKIVNDFIRKEEQNFALYNYVNELNDTVDNIQEEINGMQGEIDVFVEDDVKNESNRRKMIKEMEVKAETFGKETEEADKKNVKVCKVLDEIRAGVTNLLKEANCDSSTVVDMLGSEDGVTNKNILQYMGLIEQRTMELIRLHQYIKMKKEPPKQDKKESKNQPTPPNTQQSQKASPRQPNVAIIPPVSLEDEDLLDDGELRPLTRNEIKTLVMKSISNKVVNSEMIHKSTNRKMKAKSPN